MRSLLFTFVLAISLPLFCGTALAQRAMEKRFQPFLTRGETTWSLAGGVRKDDFKYTVAGDINGENPNIALEETFDDFLTLEAQAKVRHIEPANIGFVKGGLLIEGELDAGYTVDGNGRLSAYAGDNRTLEAARQTYNNMSGDSIGGALTLGYQIDLTGTPGYRIRQIMKTRTPHTARGRMLQARALARAYNHAGPYLSVTPLIGYAIDQQTFTREHAYQHIDTADPDDPPVGPFHTKDDVIANWYGPFLGVEGEIKTAKNMLRLRGEYHDLTYYTKRIAYSLSDTLKQDPSIDQEADGSGIVLKAEYAYALGEDYALTVDANYRTRKAEDGTYTTYPISGANTTRRLNKAESESSALHVGLRYNW